MKNNFEELIEITRTIKKILDAIKELEIGNQLGTEEYAKISEALKLAIFIENEIYSKMDIEQIEKFIKKSKYFGNGDLTDIEFVIDEYDNYDDIFMIHRRIFNHLLGERNKKIDYMKEPVEEYDPEYDVDKATGTFKFGNRTIYIFNRENVFKRVQILSNVSINIEFLNQLQEETNVQKKYKVEFTEIKYDLLFINNILTDEFLTNGFVIDEFLLERKNGYDLTSISKELLLYFIDYCSNNLFDKVLEYLREYNDEDFKCQNAKEIKKYFILNCLYLKTCMNEINDKDELLGSLILLDGDYEKKLVYSKLEKLISSSCYECNNKIKIME